MAITFDNIKNGDLAEKFRMALALVGRNIMNPNMDPEKARKISIEITFKPTDAGTINIDYTVKPVLAGFAKSKTTFFIGQDARSGKIQMNEYGSRTAPMKIEAEPQMTQTEVLQPQPDPVFDPETGEILEPHQNGPIDLRKAN